MQASFNLHVFFLQTKLIIVDHLCVPFMKFGENIEPVTILRGRDMTVTEDSSIIEKTKGTGEMTAYHKA